MTLGAFAFIAAAAGIALAVQAPAAVTTTDKSAIEKIVHDYILEHPEIIPQAIERLQAKRMSSTIADNRMALEKPYAGAWEGAANADVTVVEFFDYACGYCRASLPDLAKLVGSDAKVKKAATRPKYRFWRPSAANIWPITRRSMALAK